MFQAFRGSSPWTAFLLYFSATFVSARIVATLFAALYHRFIYKRLRRPRYDGSYRPRCSVILPVKGVVKDLQRNLESFLKLDYPHYEVLYAVESHEDAAVPVIRTVVEQNLGRARLIVAGLATRCAQKNFNQLAAIEHADNPEVYVFADADIGPGPDWLTELVRPLSKPSVTATTGFRWQISAKGRLGENIHAFQSNVLYVLFCFVATFSKLALLWGGSMAIRKEDFEKLGTAGRWAETVVDDFTLSQLVMKARKRTVLVTTCVTVTDDALETFKQALRWFERQTMFLKAYHRKTWALLAMPIVALLFFLTLWLPGAAAVAGLSPYSFFSIGGGAALVFLSGVLIHVLLYPLIAPNPGQLSFIAYYPVSLFSTLLAALRTLFTNTVTWGNVKYRLSGGGRVSSVERPE